MAEKKGYLSTSLPSESLKDKKGKSKDNKNEIENTKREKEGGNNTKGMQPN